MATSRAPASSWPADLSASQAARPKRGRIVVVAVAPSSAASAATMSAWESVPPSRAIFTAALAAGARASSMVFEPGSALPSAAMAALDASSNCANLSDADKDSPAAVRLAPNKPAAISVPPVDAASREIATPHAFRMSGISWPSKAGSKLRIASAAFVAVTPRSPSPASASSRFSSSARPLTSWATARKTSRKLVTGAQEVARRPGHRAIALADHQDVTARSTSRPSPRMSRTRRPTLDEW